MMETLFSSTQWLVVLDCCTLRWPRPVVPQLLELPPLQRKAVLARAHGADHVILYKQENTVERVLELTNAKGVNVIYDGVGKTT